MKDVMHRKERFESISVVGRLLVGLATSSLLMAGCSNLSTGGAGSQGLSHFAKGDEPLETVRIRFLEGLITRDQAAIGALLTPDFLWREDEAPVQETPFDFWDRHKLWGELQGLALAPVFKSENVMVSPKGANNPGYTGPRLGWRQVGGEWRAAYFYPGVK